MRFAGPRSCLPLVALIVMLGVVGSASAQVSDSAHKPPPNSRPATIIGYVVDSVGAAVGGAEIMVLAGDTLVVTSTTSDSLGNFTFRRVPAGGPYTLMARKLGYKPSRGRGIQLTAGDTLRLRFILNPAVVVLTPITVKGRRDRYSIYADEFAAKKGYRDLLDFMAWRRPYMLGDEMTCPALDPFGEPVRDGIRFKVKSNLILSLGNIGHSRPADGLKMIGPFDTVSLAYVRHIYVNGQQIDIPGDRIHSPGQILRDFPMHYISEIHYTDCWNTTVPVYMQYSLFITLKELSPAQTDTVNRFILAQARPAGPIEGRIKAGTIKHPSRQVWDSILRLLTGRDSPPSDTAAAAAP